MQKKSAFFFSKGTYDFVVNAVIGGMTEKNKQANAGGIMLIITAMVIGVLIGLMIASHEQTSAGQAGGLQAKVGEVMELIEREYVDSVDADSVGERLLQAMLSELDPHSVYLPASELERTDEMMRGNFEGVGIVLHREGDTTYVGQVMADGPSAGSGILPGDMIVAVDGVPVSGVGMPADSVVARLRGPRGSKVVIEVLRSTLHSPLSTLHFTIRRGVVPRHTLVYSTMLDDTTGYIILSSFATTSYNEFVGALRDLLARGMRCLVFDLRGNGGGSLQDAVGIASELLPTGRLVVYTEGAHSARRNHVVRRGGMFTSGRLVVMVDEHSASASEVVSGALQDNDRATIVGRRTFGKGLVQAERTLSDGSAMLLTTARYYTPSGRCIQRSYANGTEAYYEDYYEQLLGEAYADSMTVAILDSTPYHTVGGRVVYGGGGIAPDVPMAYRKDASFVYYNALSSKGVISREAFRYVREHAAELLKRYPDAECFRRSFTVGDDMVRTMVARGEAAGVPRNEASLRAQRPLIKAMLKANIGMALYGEQGFYDSYIPHDDDLQRTLRLLRTNEITK